MTSGADTWPRSGMDYKGPIIDEREKLIDSPDRMQLIDVHRNLKSSDVHLFVLTRHFPSISLRPLLTQDINTTVDLRCLESILCLIYVTVSEDASQ